MDALDSALRRAHELYLDDWTDEGDAELAELMPQLLAAGYVEECDWGDGYWLWNFTDAGLRLGKKLGCD